MLDGFWKKLLSKLSVSTPKAGQVFTNQDSVRRRLHLAAKMETRRCSRCRPLVQRAVRSSRQVEGLARANTPSIGSRASFCAHPASWPGFMKLLIDSRARMEGARCFGVREAVNSPKPGENAGSHSHIRANNSAKKRCIEKYQKALHGRTKLKDAVTLAHLQVPFREPY